MNKELLFKIGRILIYAAYLLLLNLVFQHDANADATAKFTESSMTEYFQEGTLLLIAVIYFFCSFRYKKMSGVAILLGGFFLMAFIRELDAYLDKVFDGAWQILAYSVLAFVLFKTYQYRKTVFSRLADYMNTFPFGFVLTGILIAFVYNRLFGEPAMWQAVMEENYLRNAKNAIEESIELLGYSICLFGAIEFVVYTTKSLVRSTDN